MTLFALAVPSVLSLLVLLRNEAARGIEGSKLEWVRARVEEQCKLLEDGLPLTFPLDALLVLPLHPVLSSLANCSIRGAGSCSLLASPSDACLGLPWTVSCTRWGRGEDLLCQ